MVEWGKTALGIELGSTRIKAVLLDNGGTTLASGEHSWQNRFENGIWTYSLEEIWSGVQSCYKRLKTEVLERYGERLTTIGAIGVSAMMHGYMVFNNEGELLTPFRTWRNNNAEEAAKKLTELFGYNIPARWSIAHLYQAILNKEEHLSQISFQTTLEGYIHWRLTGERVIGIGEASGMFPIDSSKQYNQQMAKLFNSLKEVQAQPWQFPNIFPRILLAGESAGSLTGEGARLLDPSGDLAAGVPFCPPEGDAGTGMVATNSITRRTGNVSCGTSIFGMFVLERELSKVYPEIDLVTTPVGDLVAMVHCNNCTGEINAWLDMFAEYNSLFGIEVSKSELYSKLFNLALSADKDCGGVLCYNYISGENIVGVDEGRPLMVRTTESRFSLPNLMRSQLVAAAATLKIGADILFNEEGIEVDYVYGHGGIFKTKGVFQSLLAAALNTTVAVMQSSGEGGPWGMAVLALYLLNGKGMSLESYLSNHIFKNAECTKIQPNPADVEGINKHIQGFIKGLPVVRKAVEALK